MDEQTLLTVAQAASQLGITRQSVYEAVREGRIPSVVLLGKIGIPATAIRAYEPRAYAGKPGAKRGGRPRGKKSAG